MTKIKKPTTTIARFKEAPRANGKSMNTRPNLSMRERGKICDLWIQAIETATLEHEFDVPRGLSLFKTTNLGAGGMVCVTKVTGSFLYSSILRQIANPEVAPQILIEVTHSGFKGKYLNASPAIEELLSAQCDKPIKLRSFGGSDNSCGFSCADPRSAWNLARFIMNANGITSEYIDSPVL